MARRLIVFWRHFSMSGDVAKKAVSQGGKTYNIEARRSDFPEDKEPQAAFEEILNEHGRRPEGVNPFRGVCAEHSFAVIDGWKHANVQEKEPVKEPKIEEPPLL